MELYSFFIMNRKISLSQHCSFDKSIYMSMYNLVLRIPDSNDAKIAKIFGHSGPCVLCFS